MPELTIADVIAKYETLKRRAEDYRSMLINEHARIDQALSEYNYIIFDYEQEIAALKSLQKDEKDAC